MKRRIIVTSVIGVLCVVAFIIFKRPSASQAEEAPKPVAQIQVAKLQSQAITQTLTAYGVVEAAPLGARTFSLGYDSVVKAVGISVGSHVLVGDLILEVSPTPDAQILFDTAKTDSELADKAFVTTKERYSLHLATRQDLLTAEQAARDAKIKLKNYLSRGMGTSRIVASEDGVITKFEWQSGATIPAGTPVFQLSAASHLDAHLTIEASDTSVVKVGESVVINSVNRSQVDSITSEVRFVASSVDLVTGATDVRTALPVGSLWLPGEHVRAIIEVAKKTALAAPRSAVLPDDDQQVLYTVKEGKAVKHTIQVGLMGDDLIEVISKDVKLGDDVVIVGNYELEDGMAVEISSDKKSEETKATEGAKDKAEAKTP